jgi:trehalose synthase-fused probable maltokinase
MLVADSVRLLGAEQSNTSIRIGRSHVFKLFRRLGDGENPEVEITRFLTGRTSFRAVPGLRGSLAYEPATGPASTLGVLQDWVENDGDGWSYTVAALREILRGGASTDALYSDMRRLGEITGEFHAALASYPAALAFAPEPATSRDLKGWKSSLATRAECLCRLLAERLTGLPSDVRPLAESLLGRRGRFEELALAPDLDARRGFAKIRVHGDFHLGQTLKVATGFVLFDFEGEPARPLAERRAKHCALKDVAGMLRSFDYAVATARGAELDGQDSLAGLCKQASALADQPVRTDPPGHVPLLREAFLEGYRGRARGAVFLPSDQGTLAAWLDFFELDKALYEVEYEVNNRPDWVAIPLEGMRRIMERLVE